MSNFLERLFGKRRIKYPSEVMSDQDYESYKEYQCKWFDLIGD